MLSDKFIALASPDHLTSKMKSKKITNGIVLVSYPERKKIGTIAKVLSKKMRIHWALKPFTDVVKKRH